MTNINTNIDHKEEYCKEHTFSLSSIYLLCGLDTDTFYGIVASIADDDITLLYQYQQEFHDLRIKYLIEKNDRLKVYRRNIETSKLPVAGKNRMISKKRAALEEELSEQYRPLYDVIKDKALAILNKYLDQIKQTA